MIDLSARSQIKELLDDPAVPFADIQQNMKELNTINTWLGGHKISIDGIRKILHKNPVKRRITICEIGCGGGDNLKAIEGWCSRHSVSASFIGIDISAACIAYARRQYPHLDASWITSDYKAADMLVYQPDIIFSSLFCHHFADEEIITMLQWMKRNARLGFFINDLHRHVLAYYSIRMLTASFSGSYLVKNDAPLSVARSFKKKDWNKLLNKAGIGSYSLAWKWAFRYLIVSCR